MDDALMSVFHETANHARPHSTQADHSELQFASPIQIQASDAAIDAPAVGRTQHHLVRTVRISRCSRCDG
jgi:hypothetical protein